MTVALLDVPQGSRRWLDARRCRYGASELPQIGGLTGRQAHVWRAKLGQPEQMSALWLELGHVLEPWALQLWARATGRTVEPGPVLYQERGWLLASLDGASNGEPVEAKVRGMGAPDWRAWTEETIPGAVELQVRQQAALAEAHLDRRLDAGHVSAVLLTGYGVEHRTYRIALTPERREEWADLWAPYPARWHAAYVATRTPPPDAEAADVAVPVEPTSVRRREATDQERRLIEALAAAEEKRRALAAVAAAATRERDSLRSALAVSLGPDATVPGLTWQPRKGHDPILQLEPEARSPAPRASRRLGPDLQQTTRAMLTTLHRAAARGIDLSALNAHFEALFSDDPPAPTQETEP